MIALVDYGAGNLASVRKAFAAAGAEVATVCAPEALDRSDAIVIPGVGHFGATRRLDAPWRAAIDRSIRRGAPLLGICLGMQWLFDGSDEAPDLPGLGLVAGRCARLTAIAPREAGRDDCKVPHVGWNQIHATKTSAILTSVPDGAFMYFTHAYAAPMTAASVASTSHGSRFAAAVESGRVSGVQFHPEKSGDAGLTVLRNFLGIAGAR